MRVALAAGSARNATEVVTRHAEVMVSGGVLFLVLARRWVQMGACAPGLDEGNWLAFGHALLGRTGALPDGIPLFTVPPLVPLLMALADALVGPMAAAKTVALISMGGIYLATYAVSRRGGLSMGSALTAATLLSVSSAVLEPVAFGGYPQNVAFAGLLVAAWGASSYLSSGQSRDAWVAGGGMAIAATSHHMYFLITIAAVCVVWLIWMVERPPRDEVIEKTRRLAIAGLPALIAYIPTATALLRSSYEAPVNASGADYVASITYVFPDPTWLWVAVAGSGIVYLVGSTRLSGPLARLALALVVFPLLPFAVTSEARLLPPMIAGGLIGFGMALDHLRDLPSRVGVSAFAAAAVAVAALMFVADRRAEIAFGYFSAVDELMLQSATWVDEHTDGHVAVRTDYRGWPVGWWYRGLVGGDVLVGSDERWVAFAEEVEGAQIVSELFDARSAAEARAVAARYGISAAVTRKWDWIGWRQWVESPEPVAILYDDGTRIVLDLRER